MRRCAELSIAVLLLSCCTLRADSEAQNPSDVSRVKSWVEWLADDARQGRGIGTQGLAEAESWLAERFLELGLEPAGQDGYFQAFDVPVAIEVGQGTSLSLDDESVADDDYVVAAFSSSGTIEAEVVPVGYGISANDLSHDDYESVDVAGKIVAVRRFVPAGARFEDEANQRRYGDLRYKAFNAREHGAAGVLIVDLPELAASEEMPDEAKLPSLKVDADGDAGLPVMVMRREVGRKLFAEGGDTLRARLQTEVEVRAVETRNVIGRLVADEAIRKEGAILIGAHFDHLGMGGSGSLEPDVEAPHNGADDNASGTAGLLEIARELTSRREQLRRDVWIVAFSGEESGLVGSTHFTRAPTAGLELTNLLAMFNLDMVGRLEDDRFSVLGGDSAEEWDDLVPELCDQAALHCELGGDGYGPSDQTPFYAAGVPVLHFFTGAHEDYHRTTDDAHKLDYEGIDRIAGVVTELTLDVASRAEPLTYVQAEAPVSGGDMRSFGASLGTIPDYVGDDRPGVLLAGARPGSAAEKAGIQRGDLLVALGEREIRNIYDFVYILRSAKPGDATTAVVMRGEERLELPITYDQGRGR
ncbi:MAG: M28 family peptidase [Thermoanaerobaculia bacterium]|nr:M28 family peptidase [Thermoanaerobaculia bacterium]